MRKGKKILAFVAAMAMVMAPTTTWAAQSPAQTTGDAANAGAVEGVVDKNYVSYVAPTVSDNVFDFVLDPQLLIENTDGTSVNGNTPVVTEASASVYFKNGSNYATSSDALTVVNKGSGEISVSVTATLELDATGAAINVVTGAANATDGSLNLNIHLDQVTGGSATASLEKDSDAVTKSALTLDVTAAGADASDFEVTKTAGKYEYVPKNADVSGDSVGFVFRGECNTDESADWSKVKDMSATFDVVWDVKASSGTTTAYAYYYEADGGTYIAKGAFDADGNSANPGFVNANITNFKIDGKDCTFTLDPGGYICVSAAQISESNIPAAAVWTITFTADGTNYQAILQ